METGDRTTEDVAGGPPDDRKVIRLPREWLGPRDELVPIGPAAGDRSLTADPPGDAEALPPKPDDFWGEDSAALHDAVQAPATSHDAARTPTIGAQPPIRPAAALPHNLPSARVPRLPAAPWLRARWALLGFAAAAIVAIAVIGNTESSAPQRASASGARQSNRSPGNPAVLEPRASKSFSVGLTAEAAADASHAQLALARARAREEARRRGLAMRRAQARRRQRAQLQQEALAATAQPATTPTPGPVPAPQTAADSSSSAQAASQTTETYPAPSAPGAAAPTATSPVAAPATSAGAASSSGGQTTKPAHQQAFGANGSLGPGTSPDG